MLVFQDVSCSFSAQKPSPWDNRADSRGHQRRCPTCSIFQACRWKWWKPCCFNIFKWASSDKKTLAMIIVVMINQMSYLVVYHLLSFVYGEHQNIWPIVFRFNWTISLNPHRLMSAPLKLSNLLFDLHKSIYFFQFPKMCRKTISQIPQSLEKNGRKIGHPNLPSHAQHGGLPRGNLKSSIAREEPSASTLLRCSRTWGG